MSRLFLSVLNHAVSASFLVLAVLVLRLFLKKAPKWACVLLWGLVAVRLICPAFPETALSLIPSGETVSPQIMMDPAPTIHTGIAAVNHSINPIISTAFAPNPGDSANPLQIWVPVLAVFWLTGVLAMLAYALISFWRLRRALPQSS